MDMDDSKLTSENSASTKKRSGGTVPSGHGPFKRPTSTVQQPPIAATLSLDKDADDYDMNHPRRGKAVIFNNERFDADLIEDRSTSVDVSELCSELSRLGFHVTVHNDYTYSKLQHTIREVEHEDHTDADCLVVAVLTRGDEEWLLARDSDYRVQYLLEPFTAHRCPSLAGKPKIFFIQACRGKEAVGFTLTADAQRTKTYSPTTTCTIPCHADFLIVYNTTEDCVSSQNEKRSLFIQSLCHELRSRGTSTDFLTLMTRVSHEVALKYKSYNKASELNMEKQFPFIVSMLIRKVYFTNKEYERERRKEINEMDWSNSEQKIDPSQITSSTVDPRVSCISTHSRDAISRISSARTMVEMSVSKGSKVYNMNHSRRGKAIIFSHMKFANHLHYKEYTGRLLDRNRLKEQFQNLGFEVICYENFQYVLLMNKLMEVQREDHSDADCLVIVVLTHGVQSLLYSYDVAYPVDILWSSFTADNCPSLAGKPKIFFIQDGAMRKDDVNTCYTIPCCPDILLVYSSDQGFLSFGKEVKGSLFIWELCEELKERGTSIDLLSLLTRVTRRVAVDWPMVQPHSLMKQVPYTVSMLTGDVYFHPKIRV